MDPDRELIDEQIAYYRARAGEYDATSIPEGDPLEAHTDRIRDALRASVPSRAGTRAGSRHGTVDRHPGRGG